MEIPGNRAHELARLLLGVQEPARPSTSRKAALHGHQDQVEISERGKEILRIKGLADEPDMARAEHVEKLRQAVDTGTYEVSGRKVADALVRHVLTDAVL